MTIRQADPTDAEGIARVHVASWKAAYRGLLPDDYLDGLRWETRYEFWSRELRTPTNPTVSTWVAVVDGEIAGFATVGPCRDGDRQRADTWEVYGIYLAPTAWGQGHGRRLMEACLSAIPVDAADVSLWVLDDNDRARGFYSRLGFTPDVEKSDSIGGHPVVERRYLRPRHERKHIDAACNGC